MSVRGLAPTWILKLKSSPIYKFCHRKAKTCWASSICERRHSCCPTFTTSRVLLNLGPVTVHFCHKQRPLSKTRFKTVLDLGQAQLFNLGLNSSQFVERPSIRWREVADNWVGARCYSLGGTLVRRWLLGMQILTRVKRVSAWWTLQISHYERMILLGLNSWLGWMSKIR